jgi:pimeloyl-ACP methyl ester carboxylesterase
MIVPITRRRRVGLTSLCAALIAVPLVAVATSGQAAAAAPVATFVPCPPGVPAQCGTVDVPLDRADPAAGTVRLFFEWFRHSDTSQPSLGAIVPSAGGPGLANSTVALLGVWPSVFGPLLDRRDLLVIDDRGTGQSGAIDCPALQHFTGDVVSAARACGAQLGAAASRYGSGDVAEDVDAVRAALGIDQIVYYGGSFGAHNVRAYAYRYPDRLQAAVFDSPWLSPDYTFQASNARNYARVQATVCRRSPSCIGANPLPEADLALLAAQLRAHPFDGTGFDANGVPHAVHVDESTIIDILSAKYNATPLFLNQGELTAAAQALRHGDRTPLLRLVAESPQATDNGPPSVFLSLGASIANFCSTARLVYDLNAPEAIRRAQLDAAAAALPGNAFAPFSATAWRTANERLPKGVPGGFPYDWCVPWPAPVHPNPPFPPNQQFPNKPVLILNSDLDVVSLADARAALPLFPQGKLVEVANAGHETAWWSQCAAGIVQTFIATHTTGDTRCAADPTTPFHPLFHPPSSFVPYHGVGRFPVTADDAVPARVDPSGVNQADKQDRKVASVATSTVLDAVMRADRMGGNGTGRGLRGGSYTVTTDQTTNTTTIDLQAIHFSTDVTVTGQATRNLTTNTVDAQLTVAAAHRNGNLSFHGVLYTPNNPDGQVRGTIDGRELALLVPMN